MSANRDQFRVEGVGCCCPGTMTLSALQLMGHTESCTNARKAWEANRRHLSEMHRQRRADEEIGRQIREAAAAVGDTGNTP